MNITLDDILKYREERYKSSTELIAKKGHDYNFKFVNDNHLANLFAAEFLRIIDKAETGVAVRLMDKMMRVFSLMTGEPAQIQDEKLEQTIDDAHNYLDYIGLIVKKRKDEIVEYKAPATHVEYKPPPTYQLCIMCNKVTAIYPKDICVSCANKF